LETGPIEGAMSLGLSPTLRPQRPLGGLHRTQSRKTKKSAAARCHLVCRYSQIL